MRCLRGARIECQIIYKRASGAVSPRRPKEGPGALQRASGFFVGGGQAGCKRSTPHVSMRTARQLTEKGEHRQAIGRSRGERNTKIHVLTDARGRLICRVKPLKQMLGDEAYDCTKLREGLDECGTKPISPNLKQQEATLQLQQAAQASLAQSSARVRRNLIARSAREQNEPRSYCSGSRIN